ncbi:DUF4190 domain-containing protein [Mycobacterium sp. Z3061]|uniref:DUF4190 domain-containing protein n=1 Tax=Mycobacterium sp. Z3061 TaxID=3073562 RepID=UPI002873465D|nr:DUF4190 domain-containing protein [Mycobacterium sp. Z3061]
MTEQPPNYPPPGYPPPAPGGYGAYGYPPPPYVAPRTNALAIASFVAAIAGFFTCGLGSILGLIFGVVGLGQIRRTGEGGRGLAIAGLVVSTLTLAFLVAAFIFGSTHRHDRDEDNYSSLRPFISTEAWPAAAQ